MKTNVTFIEDGHLYLNSDGVIIPSVSELIDFQYPNGYADVPAYILNNKATYGTKVHQAIEDFEAGKFTLEELENSRKDPNIKSAVRQYAEIRKNSEFRVQKMEQIADWQQRYAGTYDILTEDYTLIDIKTTATLHKDWLAVQLGLYYMAIGVKKDYGYCLWVPKGGAAQLVMVDVWNYDQCKDLVDRYEASRK